MSASALDEAPAVARQLLLLLGLRLLQSPRALLLLPRVQLLHLAQLPEEEVPVDLVLQVLREPLRLLQLLPPRPGPRPAEQEVVLVVLQVRQLLRLVRLLVVHPLDVEQTCIPKLVCEAVSPDSYRQAASCVVHACISRSSKDACRTGTTRCRP